MGNCGCLRTPVHSHEDIYDDLFKLVKYDQYLELDTRLRQLPNPSQYLTILRTHSDQYVSLLMLSASYGYNDIVRVLLTLNNTSGHVELKGKIVVSDDISIKGASALYCACYHRHFTVAKTLIELGHADVDQDTYDYPSYPLFLDATIRNRLDIVTFLLENNYADINETKAFDGGEFTALICAVIQGHTSLIEYFISKGADVNYTCEGQDMIYSRPIGLAVMNGHLEAVQLLCRAGADLNIQNDDGDTLLTVAVQEGHGLIIDYLLSQLTDIEDLELAACFWQYGYSLDEVDHVFKILKIILQRRSELNVAKISIGPIAAYDYQQECQTVDELHSIKDDPHRIFIETLLIRERIALSRNDISIVKPLHHYGDLLVQRGEFEKCLQIWIHMFYLYQRMNINTILHRFVWLFCQMLNANENIPVKWFLKVARLVFEPSHLEEKDHTAHNAFFLVIIATKILEQEGLSQSDRVSIYCWVKDICRYCPTTLDGKTLVHLCVDVKTNEVLSFRSFETFEHLLCPNKSALRLLLACGGRWLDFDAVEDLSGNTPLHLICQQRNNQDILQLFFKSGCHTDCVNKFGMTPLDYLRDPETRNLFPYEQSPLKLKCLCARLIGNKGLNIDHLGSSTSSLNKFIVLHGYHSTESTNDDDCPLSDSDSYWSMI